MSAKILSLGAQSVQSDRKTEFLQHLSAAYDSFVEHVGREPECVVHLLGELRGPVSLGWHMRGECEGAADAMLARTVVAAQIEAAKYP